jgi:hypothetical protein
MAESSTHNKVKLGELADTFEVIHGYAKEALPARLSARIVRMNRAMRPLYERYIADRTKIIAKYKSSEADDKETPGQYKIPKENVEQFKADIIALRDELVDFDAALKLPFDLMEAMNISPTGLEVISNFVEGL